MLHACEERALELSESEFRLAESLRDIQHQLYDAGRRIAEEHRFTAFCNAMFSKVAAKVNASNSAGATDAQSADTLVMNAPSAGADERHSPGSRSSDHAGYDDWDKIPPRLDLPRRADRGRDGHRPGARGAAAVDPSQGHRRR